MGEPFFSVLYTIRFIDFSTFSDRRIFLIRRRDCMKNIETRPTNNVTRSRALGFASERVFAVCFRSRSGRLVVHGSPRAVRLLSRRLVNSYKKKNYKIHIFCSKNRRFARISDTRHRPPDYKYKCNITLWPLRREE